MRLPHRIQNLLFPPRCVLCGTLLKEAELDFCRDCRTEAPRYRGSKRKRQFLDSFTAVWYYEGNVRRSLLQYKFHGARRYAAAYGRVLAMKLAGEYPEGFDLVTWVPVSPLRKLKRGYDQVELLAKAVGKELGIRPVALLRKVRHNRAQSGIHDDTLRQSNVQGVYRLKKGPPLTGERILLLDDILTTGATAGEAARVLRAGGAGQVHCAVLAAARKEF